MYKRISFCIIRIFIGIIMSLSIHAAPLLKPDVASAEYYSETYTIFADLENGAYIYGQLGVSNIGPGDKRGVCRILIVKPKGKAFNQSNIVDENQWSFTYKTPANKDQQLKVKNCQLELAETEKLLTFTGKIESQQISITLHSLPKKRQTPNDNLLLESGFYKSDILVPWAKATVRYRVNSEWITSKGFGYADHSRSTLLPAALAHQWVRFRALNDKNSYLILARQEAKDKPFDGWHWSQPDEVRTLNKLDLSNIKHKKGLHWKVNIKAQTGQFEITTEKQLLRYAPLEEKGVLARMLSYFVGNPVTYTYRANLISPEGKKIAGILEVAKIGGE